VHATFCSERKRRIVRAQENREHGRRTPDETDNQVIRVAEEMPALPFVAWLRALTT
jgi:hypothetical protein